jgi:hypothetical protein
MVLPLSKDRYLNSHRLKRSPRPRRVFRGNGQLEQIPKALFGVLLDKFEHALYMVISYAVSTSTYVVQ